VKSHRWLRRLLKTAGYLCVWFLAIGVAAGLNSVAAALIAIGGLIAPVALWDWRFARRLNSRRPQHIVAALRKTPTVRVSLPGGMSSTWDPTQGMYGLIGGPGEAEYRMADDTSVHFSYRGRWGEGEAIAVIPAVLIAGTTEAARYASAKRGLLRVLVAFYGLLPAAFVLGYLMLGGHGQARAEHGAIAVAVVFGPYVVGARVLSLYGAIGSRTRRHRAE
jgi:hypothetical protein